MTYNSRPPSALLLLQGSYWLATGIWPLLHLPSFLAVTGPKHDLWLVQTVGVLVAVIGAVLLLAWVLRSRAVETSFLAVTSAAGLLCVDLVFVSSGTISRIYLVDAVAELALIVAWAAALAMEARLYVAGRTPRWARQSYRV